MTDICIIADFSASVGDRHLSAVAIQPEKTCDGDRQNRETGFRRRYIEDLTDKKPTLVRWFFVGFLSVFCRFFVGFFAIAKLEH